MCLYPGLMKPYIVEECSCHVQPPKSRRMCQAKHEMPNDPNCSCRESLKSGVLCAEGGRSATDHCESATGVVSLSSPLLVVLLLGSAGSSPALVLVFRVAIHGVRDYLGVGTVYTLHGPRKEIIELQLALIYLI